MTGILLYKLLLVVLFGMAIGLISSIPVGAVQVEVIKKSINGHLKPALAVAAGSASSDLLYGLFTLFGIGDFLLRRNFQIAVYSLGIVVLSFILYRTIKDRHPILNKDVPKKYRKRYSFLTGFSIAVTNPGMIVWWIIGYKLFLDMAIFPVVTAPIKMLFIISGAVGLGGYLALVAALIHRLKRSVSDRFLFRANIFLICLLIVLIGYFIYQMICLIFNIHPATVTPPLKVLNSILPNHVV
jgi:threonine/homoserine/homoserine lactone efflux protein